MESRTVKIPKDAIIKYESKRLGQQCILLHNCDRISYLMYPLDCQINVYHEGDLVSIMFLDRPVQITF